MSDAISAIIPQLVTQTANAAGTNKQEAATRSFQAVMQQQEGNSRPRTVQQPEAGAQKTEGVSGASLEQLRKELTRRLDQLPAGNKSLDDLWPELLSTHTRLGMLREAMNGINGTPTGANLKGVFGGVESEWFNLEQIMRSDKDLSSGQLLGLQ